MLLVGGAVAALGIIGGIKTRQKSLQDRGKKWHDTRGRGSSKTYTSIPEKVDSDSPTILVHVSRSRGGNVTESEEDKFIEEFTSYRDVLGRLLNVHIVLDGGGSYNDILEIKLFRDQIFIIF